MTILEDYDPSLPATLGDPDQLLQVVLNLLKNAAEASGGRSGTIRLHTFYDHSLRLRRVDGSGSSLPLQIEVIDDGPGIPAELADAIFDPFVSGRENGTGLGLALVSKIVADHGGWISAEFGARTHRFPPIASCRPQGRGAEIRGDSLMDGTVLVADDDRTIRTVLTQALTRAGCKVHATSSLVTLMRWVEEGKGDLVISDVVMPDGNGIEALPRIAAERPGLPVIVISAQNTIMTAIQATEADAFDYLPKPFDLPDLMKRASRALSQKRLAAPAVEPAPRGAGDDLPLVGRTLAMQALYRLVARVMNTDLPVLITGESGSGKSLVARAIHDFSDRRTLPFVTALSADLQGIDGPSALLARARGGTIVFDEIGDFDLEAQGRIVRMLDALPANAPRVIATSQKDLSARLDTGAFRNDLFYRLGGVTLAVPALRERVEDIPLLAEHFLARAERDGAPARRLSSEATALIRAYRWPGNVRQLENTLRRLIVTALEPEISRAEVEAALGSAPAESLGVGSAEEGERLSASIARHLRRYFDLHDDGLPPPGLYGRILREMEAPLIEIALDATAGNQAKCADLLGINRNTLRKKITDLDIRVTRRRKLM